MIWSGQETFITPKGLDNIARGQPREAGRHPGYEVIYFNWPTLKGLDKKGLVKCADAALMQPLQGCGDVGAATYPGWRLTFGAPDPGLGYVAPLAHGNLCPWSMMKRQ